MVLLKISAFGRKPTFGRNRANFDQNTFL